MNTFNGNLQKTIKDNTLELEDANDLLDAAGMNASGVHKTLSVLRRNNVHIQLGYENFSDLVNERIGGYIQLTAPDRRELVQELIEDGLSQREVADVVGVGVGTVNRDSNPDVPNGTLSDDTNSSQADSVPNGTPDDDEYEVEPLDEHTPYDRPVTPEQRKHNEIIAKRRTLYLCLKTAPLLAAGLTDPGEVKETLAEYGDEFKERTGYTVGQLQESLIKIREQLEKFEI